MRAGQNGVTEKTPEKILFGAGTIHRGLKYTEGSGWNFEKTIVGATSGGSKFSVKPEIKKIEIDGVYVNAKGLSEKTGETATMELNLIELTPEIIKAATFAKDGTSADAEYTLIESKESIEEGDYWDNIAFVGKTLKGKHVIAILDNALCTSGFEQEGKSKEGAVGKYTFESYAGLDSNLTTVPWHIYYPKASA